MSSCACAWLAYDLVHAAQACAVLVGGPVPRAYLAVTWATGVGMHTPMCLCRSLLPPVCGSPICSPLLPSRAPGQACLALEQARGWI